MSFMRSDQFAIAVGISDRAARKAYAKAAKGKLWHGFQLPVSPTPQQRGGASGKSLVLHTKLCDPALLDLLGVSETLPSTAVEDWIKDRPADRAVAIAMDKQRILRPVLAAPKGSAERAQIISDLAAQPIHKVGEKLQRITRSTLYEWTKIAESDASLLIPQTRCDRGKSRVRISGAWDKGCGLPDDVQDQIQAALEATARGLFAKGRSERNAIKLCSNELIKLTVQAGVKLPKDELKKLCKMNSRFTERFREMKVVHAFDADHKAYADKHEFHVQRGLTDRPMEALMGDVHTVDLTISEALSSKHKSIRTAAFKAVSDGKEKVKAWLIAWMDASSGYMWATPVITGPGQGITQEDVANSLYDVVTCPWGGMPETFVLDNGSSTIF